MAVLFLSLALLSTLGHGMHDFTAAPTGQSPAALAGGEEASSITGLADLCSPDGHLNPPASSVAQDRPTSTDKEQAVVGFDYQPSAWLDISPQSLPGSSSLAFQQAPPYTSLYHPRSCVFVQHWRPDPALDLVDEELNPHMLREIHGFQPYPAYKHPSIMHPHTAPLLPLHHKPANFVPPWTLAQAQILPESSGRVDQLGVVSWPSAEVTGIPPGTIATDLGASPVKSVTSSPEAVQAFSSPHGEQWHGSTSTMWTNSPSAPITQMEDRGKSVDIPSTNSAGDSSKLWFENLPSSPHSPSPHQGASKHLMSLERIMQLYTRRRRSPCQSNAERAYCPEVFSELVSRDQSPYHKSVFDKLEQRAQRALGENSIAAAPSLMPTIRKHFKVDENGDMFLPQSEACIFFTKALQDLSKGKTRLEVTKTFKALEGNGGHFYKLNRKLASKDCMNEENLKSLKRLLKILNKTDSLPQKQKKRYARQVATIVECRQLFLVAINMITRLIIPESVTNKVQAWNAQEKALAFIDNFWGQTGLSSTGLVVVRSDCLGHIKGQNPMLDDQLAALGRIFDHKYLTDKTYTIVWNLIEIWLALFREDLYSELYKTLTKPSHRFFLDYLIYYAADDTK